MTFKLLIFDLDDTLIDTFGGLGPQKLLEALQAMTSAGLDISDINSAFNNLKKINDISASTVETFHDFVSEIMLNHTAIGDTNNLKDNNNHNDNDCEYNYNQNKKKRKDAKEYMNNNNNNNNNKIKEEICKYAQIGIKEYYLKIKSDCNLKPTDGTLEVLKILKQKYDLAIVSKGAEELQYWKLQKTAINPQWFKKIMVVSEGKNSAYQSLLIENKCLPSEVLVCGDKYELDLLPAKELGMVTVHFLWGRAKNDSKKYKTDYTIKSLTELLEILKIN